MNGEKEMWTYCIYEKEAEAKGEELLRKYKMGNSVRNNPITQYRTPPAPSVITDHASIGLERW